MPKPMGSTSRGIHCWIGRSCAKMPMSYIFCTYIQPP